MRKRDLPAATAAARLLGLKKQAALFGLWRARREEEFAYQGSYAAARRQSDCYADWESAISQSHLDPTVITAFNRSMRDCTRDVERTRLNAAMAARKSSEHAEALQEQSAAATAGEALRRAAHRADVRRQEERSLRQTEDRLLQRRTAR